VGFDREALHRLRQRVQADLSSNLRSAVSTIEHNKLRAFLTSLGVLFGVASVIAMLAVGRGAKQEVLDQMLLLGSNNLIIAPMVEQREEQAGEEPQREVKRFSPGLTYADAQAIARVVPEVETTSAEIVFNSLITREGLRRSGKVVGVDSSYFRLSNLALARGRWFSAAQIERGLPVAIIGHGVRTRFFTAADPIGKPLKVGDLWVTVVGVLADRRFAGESVLHLGLRDVNMDVYVPARTMLLRLRNRSSVTQRDIEMASRQGGTPVPEGEGESEEQRLERTNRNQLDRIVVRVTDSRFVPAVAEVTRRLLTRRHNAVVDFEITIPELLLRQEQRTRTIFNVVLGAIASISLVVGGIGIMNIMLASVLERTREIGVRRALGATRREILAQFLSEAVLISAAGGVAGIILGVTFSLVIEYVAGVKTLVSYYSVFVAFGVSVAVGVAFGVMPARRASLQDPVVSLRYE
jgi:putative ABC transport system permease protein